jgi:Glycosyl transferase family 2
MRFRRRDERAALEARVDELKARLDHLYSAVDAWAAEVTALSGAIGESHDANHATNQRLDAVHGEALLAQRALATAAFVSALPPQELLVSVIVTTRGRPELLRRALASVLAQTHDRWELVIAFDPGEEPTAAVVAELDDERVIALDRRGLPRGPALNLALDRATGAVVTYLDDDNVMLPQWLAALAWAFGRDPELEVAYGALSRQREDAGALPFLQFAPWDRERLERENFVDQNVIGHRRELPEARFDEELTSLHDWELLVRLTAATTPRAIPILAAVYFTGAPGRLTDDDNALAVAADIRARAKAQPAGRRAASSDA